MTGAPPKSFENAQLLKKAPFETEKYRS